MKIIILGYTGLIGNSILSKLALDTSINLICVGRNIKKNLIRVLGLGILNGILIHLQVQIYYF